MQVGQIVQTLGLEVIADADMERQVSGGYAADLLSCAMAGARAGDIWVTLQAHPNVIAVASLLDLAAVLITEGMAPDAETVHKAREAGINLLRTSLGTFAAVSQLSALGIAGRDAA
ncbi:MAG: serine kinase [Anaerolineae bacterium]|nr:serine kinase [Anaerolineae bacterium]